MFYSLCFIDVLCTYSGDLRVSAFISVLLVERTFWMGGKVNRIMILHCSLWTCLNSIWFSVCL